MSVLSFNNTKILVHLILSHEDQSQTRADLYKMLRSIRSNEGQFYEGIICHASELKLSSDEWFKLLSILPTNMLRSHLPISKMLSEEQLKSLPESIG